MTKYLLDYRGGCKGDFLCNFLNYNKFLSHGNFNKSADNKLTLKRWEGFDVEKILKKNFFIIPGHRLYGINESLIQKYNCKIIKMTIEKKYYRTASIEGFVKTFSTSPLYFKQKLKNFDYNEKIKYLVDIFLLENNLKITNKNRYDVLLHNIINCEITDFEAYDDLNKNYSTVYKKISYENIFINKNYDLFYEIKPDFNLLNYESCLERTWLPDIINIFGYELNLRKYGYRDY